MIALTKKQREVLDFIDRWIRERGYSPCYQEIAQYLGVSSLASVSRHVEGLEARGAIRRTAHLKRSIEVVESPRHPDVVRLDELDRRRVVSIVFADGTQLNPGSMALRPAIDVALGK